MKDFYDLPDGKEHPKPSLEYLEWQKQKDAEREVDFLRVGRIALVYQTTDGAVSGAWDNAARSWVDLPSGDYNSAIRKGIRIAKKQATIELLNMPVAAPEAN